MFVCSARRVPPGCDLPRWCRGEEDGEGKRCQRRRMIWWAVEKAGELGKNARKLSDRIISIKLILSLQLDFTSVCKQVCQSNQHQKFFISYDPPLFMNTPSRSDATPWINILSAHFYPHHRSVLFTNCGRQHAFYSDNFYRTRVRSLFTLVSN